MLARLNHQVQPQDQYLIQKYRTRTMRCLKLQEVSAHNQWTPCLCLKLPFNDNAKFINEVHGFFMDSFQVKFLWSFTCNILTVFLKPKMMHGHMRPLQDFSFYQIPMPKTIASDCLASFFFFFPQRRKRFTNHQ